MAPPGFSPDPTLSIFDISVFPITVYMCCPSLPPLGPPARLGTSLMGGDHETVCDVLLGRSIHIDRARGSKCTVNRQCRRGEAGGAWRWINPPGWQLAL